MKKAALSFLMFIGALSLSAEQTLAEQTKLTGVAAMAKFPARLQNSEIAHLVDASWSPNGPGDYVFAKGGHNLVIGGALAYQVKDNGDGTVTVTVAGDDPDAPVPASIVLKDGKVAIGVANPEAKRRYCLARAAKLGDEFVPDDTTWKTGEELLDGALLEVPVKSGATSEFFKVVVE